MYEVELADGRIKEYGVNIIAENILTQVDSDGFSPALMEGIMTISMMTQLPSPRQTNTLPLEGGKGDNGRPQQVGNCWLNERIKASHGLNYLSSKSPTLWKQ